MVRTVDFYHFLIVQYKLDEFVAICIKKWKEENLSGKEYELWNRKKGRKVL